MKGLDTRALLEDVLGTLKYILNRNEIRADIIKKDIFNIEIALSKPTPTDQVVELENKLANLQCSANDAAKYIRELKNESKAWKTLYHDECEAYDAKIKSLEYQLKQLSSTHSATVNALADERNSKVLGNA